MKTNISTKLRKLQIGNLKASTCRLLAPAAEYVEEYGDFPYLDLGLAIERAIKHAEAKLAKDLLTIAKLAMPDTYFASDSRCQHARKVLEDRPLKRKKKRLQWDKKMPRRK